MSIFLIILEVYFSLTLGIAGIAKIESSSMLLALNSLKYPVPKWISTNVSVLFPWVEILISIILIFPLNVIRQVGSCFAVLFFLCFFVIKLFLIKDNGSTSCGCYGKITENNDAVIGKYTVSVQFLLSIILFLMEKWIIPLDEFCYIVVFLAISFLFSNYSGRVQIPCKLDKKLCTVLL